MGTFTAQTDHFSQFNEHQNTPLKPLWYTKEYIFYKKISQRNIRTETDMKCYENLQKKYGKSVVASVGSTIFCVTVFFLVYQGTYTRTGKYNIIIYWALSEISLY